MQDPVTMNHPDLPGAENAVVERDAYRGTWYAKGWRSDDDPGFSGPEDPPVPRTAGSHEVRHHKSHVTVPGAFGQNRWFDARDEGDTRQVKVHLLGDSIFHGAGTAHPRAQGCATLIGNSLRTEFGDGGTGWVPAGLTSPVFRIATTGTPTGGTFTLNVNVESLGNQATATIPWNATAAQVLTAIEDLGNVPAGVVQLVNGGGGPFPTGVVFNFTGALADSTVAISLATNSLTGGSSPSVSITNPWTSGMGMGGCQMAATAMAGLHFANMRGTLIRIFHRNAGITGSFRWRIDGGSWTTETPPTGFGQDPGAAVSPALADTAHTVDVEWVSGTVNIFGIEATRATGVVVYNFSQSGRAASDYIRGQEQQILAVTGTSGSPNITLPAPGSFTNSMNGMFIDGVSQIPAGTTITVTSATAATMSANATGNFSSQTCNVSSNGSAGMLGANMVADPFLAAGVGRPDLVIFQLGANDPAGSDNDARTYREGISKIMRLYSGGDSVDYCPDFILVIEHIANWFDLQGEYAGMASVCADLANGSGAALVDIWGIGHRSFKFWNDQGYFADAIHPTATGHAQYAQPVIDVCLMSDN